MKTSLLGVLRKELKAQSDRQKAKVLQRFFKTSKGEYAEGDIFLGVTVPKIRAIAKEHLDLPLDEVNRLLRSKFHEERLLALLILVMQFASAEEVERESIFKLYLKNTRYINNWDLVDLSAPQIVGGFLKGKSRIILYNLVKSPLLWERRIAVLATFNFIRNNDFRDIFKIAALLLNDKEDLIHKAVGWMLREAGKRDNRAEELFLDKHYRRMPRTMLRYAIEKFPENKRKLYLFVS
jgi:3-methyladenine DNA glycosylase AlkD